MSQQLDPGRFERLSQQRLVIAPGVVVSGLAKVFDGVVDLRRVKVEPMGQDAEKTIPPRFVKSQEALRQGRATGKERGRPDGETGKLGHAALHHSKQYEEKYKPAYRVVLGEIWSAGI